jgi:AraC-like DNA-binding protein
MPSVIYQKTKGFYIEKYTRRQPMTDMHYHRAYELYYTVEGERDYYVGEHHFKLSKHDLLFIPSGMLHRTVGKGATRYLVYFSEHFFSRFFEKETALRLLPDTPFVFSPKNKVAEALQEAFAALLFDFNEQERSPEKADAIKLAGGLFRILLLISTEENIYEPPAVEDRLSLIVKHVNTNFATIEKIEQVAEKFFISKYHLCHLFKEHLGVSLVSYLNTLRIQASCKLLREGKMPMADIAAACGFHSTSYFCKVFKDEKGVSPGNYLKSQED